MEWVKLEDCCEILDSRRIPITAADRKAGPYPYYGANGIQDYVDGYIFDDDLVLLAEDGGNFGSKDKPIAYRVSGKCWINNHAHVLKPKAGLDVDYLCYSLMFYNVGGMVNGATRQKLTQASMRIMRIPGRSLNDQKEIVRLLNKISLIIDRRKTELKRLDTLIKARFVEMFGDPETCISNANATVGDVARVQVGLVIKPTRFYSDVPTTHKAFRSLNVAPFKVKDNSDWVFFTDEGAQQNTNTMAHTGDVLVVRSGAPGTSCVVTPEYDGINVIDLIIAHPDTKKVLPEYLCAYTNFPHGMSQIEATQRGIAQKHFNVTLYEQMKIFIPALSKQEAFVGFLHQVNKSKFDEAL